MKKITAIFILAGIYFFGNLGLAHSEVKAYLHLTGINGESKTDYYKDWIELLTWSWQMSQPDSLHIGGGGGAGKAIVRPLIVTKYIDRASPLLFVTLLNGQHIDEAILALQQQAEIPFEVLRIKMTGVVISNISNDTSSGQPAESVALGFAKICYKYTPQKADGSLDASIEKCWNIEKNVEE